MYYFTEEGNTTPRASHLAFLPGSWPAPTPGLAPLRQTSDPIGSHCPFSTPSNIPLPPPEGAPTEQGKGRTQGAGVVDT